MGSSKKHKKEKKRKHKRSSPSRDDYSDDSPDEKRSRNSESESRKRSRHNKQSKRSRGDSREKSPIREAPRERKPPKDTPEPPQESPVVKSGDGSSLSIEETNILRAKLGLKPLNIKDNQENGDDPQKADFVHAPAADLWGKKKQEELREKLRVMKEKREINKKMNRVKMISEDADDDVSSWVEKSRINEKKTKARIRQEEELAAMDKEFGVGGLVKQEFTEARQQEYTSANLKGINVQHSLGMFKEGKSVILTLQDQDVLADDTEDTLVNVNMVDAEKTIKSNENKTKGVGYRAYEDGEVDELGFIKVKSTLSKYDEEIEGEKKDTFVIGDRGKVDISWEQQKEQMKKEIRAQGVSLEMPKFKIASEYLTEEEIKFKKRKKKVRKVRKRETLKADDLLPLPGKSSATSDLGSRSRAMAGNIPGWDEGVEKAKVGNSSISSTTNMADGNNVIMDEDDASSELQKALDKARKVKRFKKTFREQEDAGAAKVAQHLEVLTNVKLENPSANYSTTISLNSTDEFCRQLGQMAAEMPLKEEQMEEEQLPDAEDAVMEEDVGGWNTVNNNVTVPEVNSEPNTSTQEESHAPIEAEPLAASGLAGALKLASRKGYLVEENQPKGSVIVSTHMKTMLQSQNYSIEDKNAVDHLDKYAHEKYSRDRSRHDRGIVTDFEEKKNYKPEVKIEYVDEMGRAMNPKEAFRKLSHRFHGKGSGKMKQEKRQKKRTEEDMMMKMSSTDTPLNTVAMMKEKLQNESSPYIVLSGGGKTFQAGGPGLMSKK